MNKIDWKFTHFSCKLQEFWDFKDKYIGKVEFKKWCWFNDCITLSLNQEDTAMITNLMYTKMPSILWHLKEEFEDEQKTSLPLEEVKDNTKYNKFWKVNRWLKKS